MTERKLCEAVIVAEDHKDLRTALTEILHEAGYLVFSAADGHEAYEVILTSDYACLVFLDLSMPNCDGRQFLEMTEQRPEPRPHFEVVLMSGRDEAPEFARERNLTFLKKPIQANEILSIAEKFCKQRKKR